MSAKIRLSLRANKKKSSSTVPYDWKSLTNNTEVQNAFITKLRNSFSALQDTTTTPNADTTYNHFQKACRETAAATIPVKPKVKKRTPWESEEICQKRKQLHEAALLKDSQPTPDNITSLGNARSALKETYAAEQTIYLQSKIDQITSAVSNKNSAIAWKTVNETLNSKREKLH